MPNFIEGGSQGWKGPHSERPEV